MFDFWFKKIIVFTDGAQKQADINCDHKRSKSKEHHRFYTENSKHALLSQSDTNAAKISKLIHVIRFKK